MKEKVKKSCDKHGKRKLLSDAAPEPPDLTCPITRYQNSSLRSKPFRRVRRESCQSWYNFPPTSSFFFSLSPTFVQQLYWKRLLCRLLFQKGQIPRGGTQQNFSPGSSACRKGTLWDTFYRQMVSLLHT